MKKFFCLFVVILLVISCSSKKDGASFQHEEEKDCDLKILSEENKGKLYSSLDELEELIVAKFSCFSDKNWTKLKKNGLYSFSQHIEYDVESLEGDRKIELAEDSKYAGDKNGNFSMSYRNNKNEGWDIVWLKNPNSKEKSDFFFYRKQFGGEFTKTFSMGEHTVNRDNNFNAIPSIYFMLRDHASIDTNRSKDGVITIVFSDKTEKRANLKEKKYLQNLKGTEEKHNDKLIKDFMGKRKENIIGEMILQINQDGAVKEMALENLSFTLADDNVRFTMRGKRTLSADYENEIKEPEYKKEYHRRTLDSTRNVMKKD